MKNSYKLTKNLKGYSLLEMIVSLSIVGVATIVMMNFMIMSFKISAIIMGRSLVREELATVMNSVGRDFKNSDFSPTCAVDGLSCEFSIEGVRYRWYLCSNSTKICKDKYDSFTSTYVNVYTLSNNVNINYFKFENGYSSAGLGGNSNILLTISAAHSNESLGINNVIKQSSYSLRNYEL